MDVPRGQQKAMLLKNSTSAAMFSPGSAALCTAQLLCRLITTAM